MKEFHSALVSDLPSERDVEFFHFLKTGMVSASFFIKKCNKKFLELVENVFLLVKLPTHTHLRFALSFVAPHAHTRAHPPTH